MVHVGIHTASRPQVPSQQPGKTKRRVINQRAKVASYVSHHPESHSEAADAVLVL